MVRVSTNIDIDAPVSRVFEYMDVPEHQVEITPSLTRSILVERLPNGGVHAEYTFKMAGLNFSGRVLAAEYRPNERITFEMVGDIEGEIRWTFEDRGDSTRFTYEADYEVPTPVLKQVAEQFAHRYNQREAEATLQNLKDRIESDRE